MYVRLAKPGAVFDIGRLVKLEYKRIEESGESIPDSTDDRYLLAIGMVIRTLVMCLTWRSKEILAGEFLAAKGGCDHKLLAVKHPTSVASHVVLGETPGVDSAVECYLSHPITRPRRERNKGSMWPAFVAQYHEFIEKVLSTRHAGKAMILIMPTAIDEYRIRKADDGLLVPAPPRAGRSSAGRRTCSTPCLRDTLTTVTTSVKRSLESLIHLSIRTLRLIFRKSMGTPTHTASCRPQRGRRSLGC